MPYKDPEKRRTYHREYQRRRRGKKGLTNPGQTPKHKAYVCIKVPNLRFPGIVFKNSLFVTNDPKEQATIEQDPMYGNVIFGWVLMS